MKNITRYILASLICFFSFSLIPSESKANSYQTDVQSVNDENTNNYVEYVEVGGQTYKYTYSDDGKLLEIETVD